MTRAPIAAGSRSYKSADCRRARYISPFEHFLLRQKVKASLMIARARFSWLTRHLDGETIPLIPIWLWLMGEKEAIGCTGTSRSDSLAAGIWVKP